MFSEHKKIALTFDVELWHETDWLKPYLSNSNLDDTNFENSITIILELLKKHKYTATFFVTDLVARTYPELIKRISHLGHEVGSHGIGHKRLPSVHKEDYEREFKTHINHLEQCIGKKIIGFRAPHFSLNNESKWILDILKQNGLKYDSSIMPSAFAEYGHTNAPTIPYKISNFDVCTKDFTSTILEIPVSIFGRKIRVPFAGGIYFRFLPFTLFRIFLNHTFRLKQTPIMYFHPHELDPHTPRITSGPRIKRYLKYFGTKKSMLKFEKLLKHYSCDSIENIFFK